MVNTDRLTTQAQRKVRATLAFDEDKVKFALSTHRPKPNDLDWITNAVYVVLELRQDFETWKEQRHAGTYTPTFADVQRITALVASVNALEEHLHQEFALIYRKAHPSTTDLERALDMYPSYAPQLIFQQLSPRSERTLKLFKIARNIKLGGILYDPDGSLREAARAMRTAADQEAGVTNGDSPEESLLELQRRHITRLPDSAKDQDQKALRQGEVGQIRSQFRRFRN